MMTSTPAWFDTAAATSLGTARYTFSWVRAQVFGTATLTPLLGAKAQANGDGCITDKGGLLRLVPGASRPRVDNGADQSPIGSEKNPGKTCSL
jgi:hypothetical protein